MVDQEGEPRDEIVLKPTGGTVYLTRDLASIRYRTQSLGADKLLYVIGKEQRIHCLVLFTMAEQLGYIRHGQALHTAFGHLNVGGRKMRSRGGTIVLLNDLIDEAIAAATGLARERGQAAGLDGAQQAEVARQVGIGSLIYNDLRQDRQSDIEFNPDVAGSLEAGQGPYIQYAYARLRSITGKFEAAGEPSVPAEPDPTEIDLAFHLASLPRVVAEAATRNTPHRVAAWVNRLAQLSNAFYHARSIKDAGEPERSYLLAIVRAAEQGFENACELLHMELPERM
jgi:arginyl-tRNA synthetase